MKTWFGWFLVFFISVAAGISGVAAAQSAAAGKPAIHGPRIVGTTPGRPFLFLVPATGGGPLRYGAAHLPEGLRVDADTGIISGAVTEAGITDAVLEVSGTGGKTTRGLRIVAEPGRLALTPPMGWNPWNIWAREIDAQKIRDAADLLVSTGLAAHGYQYVNLDDCWAGKRDENGVMHSNDRFPDMNALGDYIHAKGLKFGMYTSPGPETCAGYEGSYGHEEQDAQLYASWGVDYLKYDWCSYTSLLKSGSAEELQRPFRIMRAALDKCGRDIVYSWSQGGIGKVYTWGAALSGNLWRTTGDINATWESMSGIGFAQNPAAPFAQPGHWNDPDMLVAGVTKWEKAHLTPDEVMTHITLWSLLAAPLLLGCDLSKLDAFTLELLTNDEMIDVNQDPLGQSATRREMQGVWAMAARKLAPSAWRDTRDVWGEVWARPLSDGTIAAGLFNRGGDTGVFRAHWEALGIAGKQPVRDLWHHEDLGVHDDAFQAVIPPHGAVFIKIGTPKPPAW